jgi:predicted aminopeptidase
VRLNVTSEYSPHVQVFVRVFVRAVLLGFFLPSLLCGCTSASYYWQSVSGHVQLMRATRPVVDWLADSQTPESLKTRLALSQRMRDFAVSELALPDNASYRGYADLKRRAVVWNVVAAPPLSLTLKTWCFPVMGCVGYRGYFDEAAAKAEAEAITTQEGLEVSVYGVPAYSTLGWLNWAGGDPLLSTFIGYPEGELARMVFHELAHQVVYVADDTAFNESFATAVERLGSARWLSTQASPSARAEYEAFDAKRRQFKALTQATREVLQTAYQQNRPYAPENNALLAIKNEVMRTFRNNYAALKARAVDQGEPAAHWAGFDAWVARANNASFGAQAAYDDHVPAFEALFEAEHRDWRRFYAAVKRLGARPKAERHQHLKTLLQTEQEPHHG